MPLNAAQQALLYDALLAGLAFDVGDEPAAMVPPPVVAKPVAVTEAPEVAAPRPKPVVPVVETGPAVPVVVEEPCRVWREGPTEGVVVIMVGGQPPRGGALTLLQAMLRAVGLAEEPLGFVGVAGALPKQGVGAMVSAELAGQNPRYTLVLGQALLGALLGRIKSVEDWHTAPQDLALPGCVGVTYPPEFLLMRPLFKALAWKNLQRWQQGFGGVHG